MKAEDVSSIVDEKALAELSNFLRSIGSTEPPTENLKELWMAAYTSGYGQGTNDMLEGTNPVYQATMKKREKERVLTCAFCGKPDPDLSCGCIF